VSTAGSSPLGVKTFKGFLTIKDLGLTSSNVVLLNQNEARIDLQAYRSKFTNQITVINKI
jgi:hypothetical protein